MAMMEFAIATEQRRDVTWVALNNRAFGWPQHTRVLTVKQQVATDFLVAANLAAISQAQGCAAERVTDPAEVEPALIHALAADEKRKRCLVDVTISQHDYRPRFVRHHAITGASSSLPLSRLLRSSRSALTCRD